MNLKNPLISTIALTTTTYLLIILPTQKHNKLNQSLTKQQALYQQNKQTLTEQNKTLNTPKNPNNWLNTLTKLAKNSNLKLSSLQPSNLNEISLKTQANYTALSNFLCQLAKRPHIHWQHLTLSRTSTNHLAATMKLRYNAPHES